MEKLMAPTERYRSLKNGKKLLEELCDPGKTPRVPSAVRDKARSILRYFPTELEIEKLAEAAPEIINSKTKTIKDKQ
jgi:hypothetical protein